MKPATLRRLYPRSWQSEYDPEFEDLLGRLEITPKVIFDTAFHAIAAHGRIWVARIPGLAAWLTIGGLNIVAKEVQWPAGALLLTCGVASAIHPRRWIFNAVAYAAAIPFSSLYFYPIPNIRHEPLFHTVVALIPALVGSPVLGVTTHRTGEGSAA